MTAPWFRTTDLARWGASNSGGDLSATMFDENTWWNYQQIIALQARPIPSEIDHFVLVGDQLTVVMTDHSTRGPYTIPTSAFRFRGAWLPSTAYLVNDVFTINGNVYIVIFAHTSNPTFSAGANDGLGHNYYGLMLSNPGNSLPTGGAVGQMIIKTTVVDFATSWGWPLPTGGTTNQLLMKNSSTNQDASWKTSPFVWAPPVSPPASSGDVLATVDGSSTNTHWISLPTGYVHVPPVSPPGAAGDVLATADGSTINMEWLALSLAATTPFATTAQYLDNTSTLILTTDQVWAAANLVALTDAATIAVDMGTLINAKVTLAGNRTLGNPSNTKNGQTGVIELTQDATGSRTLAYASNWKFAGGTPPVLSTTANATDLLFYQVISSTVIYASLAKGVS